MPLGMKCFDHQIKSFLEIEMIVFDPGLIDGTGDHTSLPGRVFLAIRSGGRDGSLFAWLDTGVRASKDPERQ
jgi:hypothetical protein